ncbi:Brp/Blh family beta-carotene 15,15'-dioxygenase [Muriicola sp. E247]|uniref:Brp/Blh family beta-carotene 15,15'-dioxygenase n=1 Tax=Muriicola sp. E247 TaxID=3242730 RepID=UPI003525550F
MIVLTFFFLWITVSFNIEAEAVLAYFLIFTFGILHGSNDLKLIQQTSSASKKMFFFRALASYVAVIAMTVVFFAIVPALALVFFILASSYHFGEQHWSARVKPSPLSYIFYSCYGLVIFFLLFYTNAEEVSSIIYQVTGIQILSTYYLYVLCTSFGGFLGIYLWSQRKKEVKVNMVKELFYLLVFAIVFKTASLLWAFSIYFVVWHSIPSLMDQTTYLYGKVNKSTLLKYLKTSFVYWLISMIGLGILYFLFHEKQGLFLSLMIYFLAAITFPHVIVMNRLNQG